MYLSKGAEECAVQLLQVYALSWKSTSERQLRLRSKASNNVVHEYWPSLSREGQISLRVPYSTSQHQYDYSDWRICNSQSRLDNDSGLETLSLMFSIHTLVNFAP
ncbi:hypothetical protein R1flu_005872 [Riccia fluitans]|uniref:Uncharacterized protein n=1 Tax=Riccia fluitans TaxID=41844 RepID=A0ABD1YUM6_9MARC